MMKYYTYTRDVVWAIELASPASVSLRGAFPPIELQLFKPRTKMNRDKNSTRSQIVMYEIG